MKYLPHLGFLLRLLDEVGVVGPVAASDEGQHQRRHRVYLLVRGGRMRRAHRFGLSSSVNWICVCDLLSSAPLWSESYARQCKLPNT